MHILKRTSSFLCYLLGGLLLAFYIVTLWQSLHPNPSTEYRMFYLDQQLAFWPGENGLAIESGSTLSFGPDCGPGQGANHLSRGGWVSTGETGWQSRGADSALYFTAEPDVQYSGSVTLQGTSGQQVVLYAGDEEVGQVLLTGGENILDFTCTVPDTGLLTLCFSSDSPITILEMMFA